MEYFRRAKETISPFLEGWFKQKSADFGFIQPWGPDVMARLADFTLNGKMIRGGLTLLGHEIHGGSEPEAALRCAAAMELFQSGFLIHDDIMDRDRLRRGKPSFFMQYVGLSETGGLHDPYHQGESLGICGGDVALFLGFDLLSQGRPSADLLGFCMREITAVGLAQMQDVYFGASPQVPREDQILGLYTYKTGRYSFSLPLMAGAMLAGQAASSLPPLSRLGELMGVIFQIRDDELGLFGDEAELGKSIGSDIREGKKTIFYRALLDAASPAERSRAQEWYGSATAGMAEVAAIRTLMETTGARRRVQAISQGMQQEADGIIGGLAISADHRRVLADLLGFISSRGV